MAVLPVIEPDTAEAHAAEAGRGGAKVGRRTEGAPHRSKAHVSLDRWMKTVDELLEQMEQSAALN